MGLGNFYNQQLSLSEVIDCAKLFNNNDTDKFAKFPYLYSADEDSGPLKLTTSCYLSDSPEIIDKKEVFPKLVLENGLSVLCSGEIFMDVYDDLDDRYPDFTKEQFIAALNYYMDNDDYIEF
ncbi:hypothetical protein A7P95_07890 [Eikenella longinqua]|uniref:DUF7716 domain-containing protein n=2 Tax=Neisseriaceae TaxID=481 RepID=A0A1A9RX94_9NEIS|nr:hypothetical protein A7P95_07890 [Eikenella longinqua]